MTPCELNIRAEIYSEKMNQEQEEKIALVHLGEWFHRQETLKPVKEYLRKEDEMTDDEMLENVKRLNAMFGGSVVNKNEEVE